MYSNNENNCVVPMVTEQVKGVERTYDVYSRLLKENIIFVAGEINTPMANAIVAQLLFLESQDSTKPISLYINSPGGHVSDGMAIVDTMHLVKNPITTICVGMSASMGAFILSQGDKGSRFILPNAEVMIHQPLGGAQGQATDIENSANHILKIKEKITKMLAEACGQPVEKVKIDCERDYWLDAKNALKYGIVDEIISGKEKIEEPKEQSSKKTK